MWRVSSLVSGVDQACHNAGKRVFVIPENNSPEQKTRNKKAWPGLAALHALHGGLVWMQLDFFTESRDQMTSHRHSRQRSVHRRCERALNDSATAAQGKSSIIMQILAPFCFACGRHLERGFSAAKLLAAHSVCWRYGPISLWRWIIFFRLLNILKEPCNLNKLSNICFYNPSMVQ